MTKDKATILFIRPGGAPTLVSNAATNRLVPLSMRYCAALLEQEGYKTCELDGLVAPFTAGQLSIWAKNKKPDVAVFSIERFQHQHKDYLFSLTEVLKESCGAKTIAYGPYPTYYPEAFLGKDRFDAVCLGEPEATITNAIKHLAKGKTPNIPGVAFGKQQAKKPLFVKDVDSLPQPLRYPADTQLYYCNYPLPISKTVRWGSMIAGRGCGRACTFCSPFDRITFSRKVRPRSIDSIYEEAMQLVQNGANAISFEDDDPTFDKERTLALTKIMDQVPADYILHARVDELDGDLLSALASSGCKMIKLGVESGSPAVIDRLKKGDGKIWPDKTIEVAQAARRLGMAVTGLFIVGCPDETEKDLACTKSLMEKAPFDLIQLHFFTPYPGSHIHNDLDSTLTEERAAALYHYDPHTLEQISFSTLPAKRLQEWAKRMYRSFAFRPGYIASHLKRFGGFYLHNPQVFFRLSGGLSRWTNRS